MPFDHNDHYHRLLLRQVPQSGGMALDVGCGTGGFARRLASLGMNVDAVDPSERVIAEARALSGQGADGPEAAEGADSPSPRFLHADVTDIELPKGHYDFVSCLAALHHMPFDTVATLRDVLAPGGVLVILGCYQEKTRSDWMWGLVASPVNAVVRLSVAVGERLLPGRAAYARAWMKPPVAQPRTSLPEIRRESARLLPDCAVRRLLFWRYLLVFRNDGAARPS